MSSKTPVPPSQPADTAAVEAPGVNLERKARKEAQKALKAQQAAEKKAAKAAASAASQASSSTTTSSSKDKSKGPRKQSAEEQLSRALAYLLRHGADKEGLAIRADGYILLRDVLDRPRVKSVNMAENEGGKRKPELQDVQAVTASNDKKRFELLQEKDEWWVRAVQGHSLKQVVQLEHTPLTLDNLHLLSTPSGDEEDELAGEIDAKLNLEGKTVEVIHGTYSATWEEILSSGGLKPMSRNHIHLAKGKFGAKGVVSGMRKSANRLIYIDIARALRDGIEFVMSSNGVVLTPGDGDGVLSVKYFTRVEDQRGEVVWSPESSK